MKTALIATLALLSAPLHAQVYTPPPPGSAPGRRVQPEADPAAALSRNITIRLQGEVAKQIVVDLAVTGTGPTWTVDQLVGEDDTTLTCEYQVQEKGGIFRVTYSVGVRVAFPSSRPAGRSPAGAPGQPQPPVSITYRDIVIRGTVACRPGEPVEILKNGSRQVQLTLETPPAVEIVPPAPGPGQFKP
jgi:hypothetical protein